MQRTPLSRTLGQALQLGRAVLCAVCLLGATVAGADDAVPAAPLDPFAVPMVAVPGYPVASGRAIPEAGTYTYEVSWGGIPAASVSVLVAPDGAHVKVRSEVRTYSAIDLLYKLRYVAEGTLDGEDLHPLETTIDQRENSRHKFTKVVFHPEGKIEAFREQKGKENETREYQALGRTLDPFSAALVARAQRWTLGETRVFDTFNGRARYLIALTAKERVRMLVNNVERDVLVVVPRVTNVGEGGAAEKLRGAKIYITDDEEAEILQIVSEVFIGSVTTKLITFTPAASGGVQLADDAERQQRVRFRMLS